MTPKTQQAADSIASAQTAIRHAREIQESDCGKWLFEVLRKRCDQMADDILHDNSLSGEDREALRRERLGLQEALRTAADLENASIQTLARYNIKA